MSIQQINDLSSCSSNSKLIATNTNTFLNNNNTNNINLMTNGLMQQQQQQQQQAQPQQQLQQIQTQPHIQLIANDQQPKSPLVNGNYFVIQPAQKLQQVQIPQQQQQSQQQQQQHAYYINSNVSNAQTSSLQMALKQPAIDQHQAQIGQQSVTTNFIKPITIAPNQQYFSTNVSSPRIIIQNQQQQQQTSQQQQQAYIIHSQSQTQMQPQQTNIISNVNTNGQQTGGQIFLLNNKILPIQSLNLKPIVNSQTQQQQQPQIQSQQAQHSQQVRIQPLNSQTVATINSGETVQNQNVLSGNSSSSGSSNNVTTVVANNTSTALNQSNSNLAAEIAEKMKTLEQIQSQLKYYQSKLNTALPKTENSDQQQANVFTQQQIQQVLNMNEQTHLHELIIQRKSVQNEIGQLQHKLLSPLPSATINTTTTTTTTHNSNNNNSNISSSLNAPADQMAYNSNNSISNQQATPTPTTQTTTLTINKSQLIQQVINKINVIKSTKSITTTDANGQPVQQLVLTQDELDQLKKLIELKNLLQNETNNPNSGILLQQLLTQTGLISLATASTTVNSTSTTTTANQSRVATTTTSTSNVQASTQQASNSQTQTIKINELNKNDKMRLLELIKNQINQLKATYDSLTSKQGTSTNTSELYMQQSQIREKLNTLIKKKAEIEAILSQENSKPGPIQQQQQQQQQQAKLLSAPIVLSMNNPNTGLHTEAQTGNSPASYQILNQSGQVINVVNGSTLNFNLNGQSQQSQQTIVSNSNIPLQSNQQQQKQTPIKIKNFLSTNQYNNVNSYTTTVNSSPNTLAALNKQQTTPLRTLVINNRDNTLSSSSTGSPVPITIINGNTMTVNSNVNTNQSSNATQTTVINKLSTQITTATGLIPLSVATNLHKQQFPHVQFKCLNFEELAQHGLITKQTDELTIILLKQLDEKASTVINQDQLQSFAKNQVKLVKKYLEQQQALKTTVRNRIHEQLNKEQKTVVETDCKQPFVDRTDAIKRLSSYHLFQKTMFEPSEEDSAKFDECYEQVSEKLLKIADAMKKRFHLFQLRSMQKEVVSSEETLLLKLFVDDLKHQQKDSSSIASSNSATNLLMNKSNTQPMSSSTSFSNVIDSPNTSIRKLVQSSNTPNATNVNNDFLLNQTQSNLLKRSLKYDDHSPSDTHRLVKQPHMIVAHELTASHSSPVLSSFSATKSEYEQSKPFEHQQMLQKPIETPNAIANIKQESHIDHVKILNSNLNKLASSDSLETQNAELVHDSSNSLTNSLSSSSYPSASPLNYSKSEPLLTMPTIKAESTSSTNNEQIVSNQVCESEPTTLTSSTSNDQLNNTPTDMNSFITETYKNFEDNCPFNDQPETDLNDEDLLLDFDNQTSTNNLDAFNTNSGDDIKMANDTNHNGLFANSNQINNHTELEATSEASNAYELFTTNLNTDNNNAIELNCENMNQMVDNLNELVDANNCASSNNLNGLTGLDEFMLNEDELAVQNLLDF